MKRIIKKIELTLLSILSINLLILTFLLLNPNWVSSKSRSIDNITINYNSNLEKEVHIMNNEKIITKFYSSFANGNYQEMATCYHEDVVFQDPAFGKLTGNKVLKMWEMLLSNKEAAPKISFSNVKADGGKGSADWVAEYIFGPKKRKVVNQINANFIFKDGKIIEHTDSFNTWKWSRQALGPIGYFIGWTPFMKKKIQKLANKKLNEFIKKQSS